MCHFPHLSTTRPTQGPPGSKQIENTSRHNSEHPKAIEKSIPHSRSHIAVEKKMVHRLLSFLTYATSVDHDNVALPEIVQGEDLSKSRRPRKKSRP
jgi:hypothetical protein